MPHPRPTLTPLSTLTVSIMTTPQACEITRHVRAALLHLGRAQVLAENAGIDLSLSDYDPGPAAAFRRAYLMTADLDTWAMHNACRNGAGADTWEHTDRWCHTDGGALPTMPTFASVQLVLDGAHE